MEDQYKNTPVTSTIITPGSVGPGADYSANKTSATPATSVSGLTNTDVYDPALMPDASSLEAPATSSFAPTTGTPVNQETTNASPPKKGFNKAFLFIGGVAAVIVLLVSLVFGLLAKKQGTKLQPTAKSVNEQGVTLGSATPDVLSVLKLKGSENKLIVNGDIITTGRLTFANSNSYGQFIANNLSGDREYLLPDASGTLCLDTNNCNFATGGSVVGSIAGVKGNLSLGTGLSMQGGTIVNSQIPTTVNGFNGNVVVQGTTNQVGVTSAGNIITLSTPQDIAITSTPTFVGVNATTLNITGDTTTINNIAYTWPVSQINGVLVNDGSGGLTWSAIAAACPTCFVNGGNSFGASAVLGTNDANSLSFETNNTSRMKISATTGHIGLGTTVIPDDCSLFALGTCNSVLNVQETATDFSKTYTYGIDNNMLLNPAGDATNTIAGINNIISTNATASNYNIVRGQTTTVSHGGTGTISFEEGEHTQAFNAGTGSIVFQKGQQVDAVNISTGSVSFSTGINANSYNASSGTIGSNSGLDVSVGNFSTGTITTNYGINVATGNLGAGTITTNYGAQIQSAGAAGTITTNYGLEVQAQTAGVSDYGVAIGAADTQTLWLSSNADNTTAAAGIAFGLSRDTIVYRSGANELSVTGSILPSADNTYDLGSNSKRWRDIYLGPTTMHIGTSTSDESQISYNTTTNSLILKPATGNDSTSALQVQTAAGTGVLTVDTTNGQTILRSAKDSPTLGSELVTSQDFSNATYWTCSTGWTTTTTTATHNTGNSNTCAATASNFTVSAATRYEITFTISGLTAGNITPSIGGVSGSPYFSNATYTVGITTTGTGALTFSPTSTFDGTISAISVKTSTGTSTPVLSVQNQSGTESAQLRVTATNLALGQNNLQYTTSGTYNTAIGQNSLQNNTTGFNNTANGSQSLYANTTGYRNTATGYQSSYSNTTGYYNTATGYRSLYTNTTGYYNTAAGMNALYSNTTGYTNTAFGLNALYANTTGSNNVALGYQAGRYIADGSTANQTSNTSVYLGQDTKANASGDTNEVVIGYNTTGNGSNTVTLGNSSITNTYLQGTVTFNSATTDITTGTNQDLTLLANGTGSIILNDSVIVGASSGTPGTVEKFRVNTPTTVDNSATAIISTAAAADKGLVIQGSASQSAALLDIQSSAGGSLATISSSGTIRSGGGSASGPSLTFQGDQNTGFYSTGNNDWIGVAAAGSDVARFTSAGLEVASTGSVGTVEKFRVNTPTTVDNSANAIISTSASTSKGLVIQGSASQSANLQEWQDSTGALLASVSYGGVVRSTQFQGSSSSMGFLQMGSSGNVFRSNNASRVNLIAKGESGQTANLQEWQSSAGAVLASLNASGNFAPTLGTTDTATYACINGSGQIAGCSGTSTGSAFVQGGNSFGATATLGTNDANSLAFKTNGTTRAYFDTNGHFLPNLDNTYDLGSNSNRWRDLYVGPASLHVQSKTTDGAYYGDAEWAFNVLSSASSNIQGNLNLAYNASPKFTFSDGGFIGIGTTSPSQYLHVVGGGARFSNVGGSNLGAQIAFYAADDSTQIGFIGDNSAANNNINIQANTSILALSGQTGITFSVGGSEVARFTSTGLEVASTGSVGTVEKFRVNTPTTVDNSAASIMSANAATDRVLVLQGAASQSGEFLVFQNSAGTTLAKFNNNADLYLTRIGDLAATGSTLTTNPIGTNSGAMVIQSRTSAGIPLIAKGAASQTADLQQWQDSTGAVLVSISPSGLINAANGSAANPGLRFGNDTDTGFYVSGNNNWLGVAAGGSEVARFTSAGLEVASTGSVGTVEKFRVNTPTTVSNTAVASIATGADTNVGLVIQGNSATQSANLLQFQNSSGIVLSKFDVNGNLYINYLMNPGSSNNASIYTSTTGTQISRNVADANTALAVTQTNASSTGAIQTWSNSGGVVAQLTQAGVLEVNSTGTPGTTEKFRVNTPATVDNSAATILSTGATTSKGLVIQGSASQSANLQEWQSSTGGKLAFVDSYGGFYGLALGSPNQSGAYLSLANNSPITLNTNGASQIGLVVKGAASQTADLAQFQNSSGTNLLSVTSAGALQGNNASGTNVAGGNITINGGQGTGTGNGGNIVFQFAAAGASGSSLNALATACTISGTNGSLSCPGTGSNSERFGSGASATNTDSLAIGRGSSSTGISGITIGSLSSVTTGVAIGVNANAGAGIAVGQSASTSCGNCIAIGPSAVGGSTSGIAIGANSTVSNASYPNIALGTQASATHNQSFVIGYQAASTAANQWVVGSSNSFTINDAYFGKGVVSASPVSFTMHATGSSTAGTAGATLALQAGNAVSISNTAGGALNLNGGQGTGTGNGGNINLQIANPGSSGSSLNTLTTVMSLSGTNGSALFQNATDSTTALQVKNAAGTTNVFTVDTSTPQISINVGTSTNPAIIVNSGGSAITRLVDGSGAVDSRVEFYSGGSSAGRVGMAFAGGNSQLYLQNDLSTQTNIINTGATGNIVFGTNNTTRLTIDNTGVAYMGNGVTNASPAGGTLQGTGGSGTNIAGASLTIAGGQGTGTGVGGNIVFQFAAAGASGSSLNALATACTISGTNGSLSCPGAGANSERFGSGASATNTDSLAIGRGSSSTGISGITIGSLSSVTTGVAIGVNANAGAGIAVGQSASTSCGNCIAIGPSAVGGSTSGIAIGANSTVSNASYPNIALGTQASATHNQSFVIGYQAASTAANQWVVGSSNSFTINDAYFGKGVVSASPATFTLHSTGGSGTDIAGAALQLAGGQGTGTGVGGNIVFQFAAAGASGSSLNALATACTISGTNGSLSCPGAGANSERFGAGSLAGGATSVAVGNTSTAPGTDGVAIGYNSSSGAAANNVAIGRNSSTGNSDGVALGRGASTSGGYGIAIGSGASVSNTGSIAIGTGATSTAANQVVFGSSGTNGAKTSVFFGNGVTAASPQGFTLNATGGSGTDIAGADLMVAAGKATGNAASGNILFQTSTAGGSGTTLQSLATVARITGTTLQVGSTGTPGTVEKFRVNTPTTVDNLAASIISTGATTSKGLVVQGVASQTANLQEWQNSTGTAVAFISSAGTIRTGTANNVGLELADSNHVIYFNNPDVFYKITGATGDHRFFTGSSATERLRISATGLTTITGGTTGDALTVNNSTSTGNILNLQANGTNIVTVANKSAFKVMSVNPALGDPIGNLGVVEIDPTITLTADSANVQYGITSTPTINQAGYNSSAANGTIGLKASPSASGASGTVSSLTGVYSNARNTGAGTVNNAVAIRAGSNSNSGGGTLTSNYGIYVDAQTAGINDYGIQINTADTQTLWLSGDADNTTANAGIAFGSSRDTNLYRSAAATLATNATTLNLAGASGTISTGTSNAALTVKSNGSGAATFDSGTTGAVNIGTGANAKTVTVGSTNGASATTIQSGTGALALETQGTGGLNIGANAVAQTITIGNATGATDVNVNLGSGVFNVTNTAADANNVAQFNNAGATNCTVQPGGTGFACSSDARLKTNVAAIINPLDTIRALRGVHFNWIDNPNGQTQSGFIAQELMQIVPEAVSRDENGYYVANYSTLVPYLVGAAQAQDLQISGLQQGQVDLQQTQTNSNSNVANLTSRISTLEQKVTVLESGQGNTSFASLNVSGAATVYDLSVTGAATVAQLTVTGNATIAGNLTVQGHILGNTDTRGTVTVPAGQTQFKFTFVKPYATGSQPVVILTPKNTFAPSYRVESTDKDFTVYFESAAATDVIMNYQVQQ